MSAFISPSNASLSSTSTSSPSSLFPSPSPPPSSTPLQWSFVSSFGDDSASSDDLVTAVSFNVDGKYLAAGDKAGRICIFEQIETEKDHNINMDTRPIPSNSPPLPPFEYKFYTEFQSHEPEFDPLKSLEIEERINNIEWAQQAERGKFLFSANDKTIKFWKIAEKKIKKTVTSPSSISPPARSSISSSPSPSYIHIPSLSSVSNVTTASLKRTYVGAHQYHIHSLSTNSDRETFCSSDDLRINLWSIDHSLDAFTLVDLKPNNLEELTEVITSSHFHPSHCHILLFSTSRGSLKLGDLRDSALCDHHSKVFEGDEDPTNKTFFSEILSSIHDAKFTPNGKYIVSRDYFTLKVWDINMESKPLYTIPIHDYLKIHTADLYENDCIAEGTVVPVAVERDGGKYDGVEGAVNIEWIPIEKVKVGSYVFSRHCPSSSSPMPSHLSHSPSHPSLLSLSPPSPPSSTNSISSSSSSSSSFPFSSDHLTLRRVNRVVPRGIRPCLQFTFDDGNTLQCTHNHRILIYSTKHKKSQWMEASDLTLGMKVIAMPVEYNHGKDSTILSIPSSSSSPSSSPSYTPTFPSSHSFSPPLFPTHHRTVTHILPLGPLPVWDLSVPSLEGDPYNSFICGPGSLLVHNCLFDKFDLSISHDGKHIVTGSYNNNFVIHSIEENFTQTIEGAKEIQWNKEIAKEREKRKAAAQSTTFTAQIPPFVPNVNLMDFGKKALHVGFHPKQQVVTMAGLNKLYLFQGERDKDNDIGNPKEKEKEKEKGK